MSDSPLLIVQINPEMRVKLERGPAEARLTTGKPSAFVVRIENEARTSATLHLRVREVGSRDRWLRHELGEKGKLTGSRVQRLTLTLTPDAAGMREALFVADIGQGTQDLGFRAELAILFHSRP